MRTKIIYAAYEDEDPIYASRQFYSAFGRKNLLVDISDSSLHDDVDGKLAADQFLHLSTEKCRKPPAYSTRSSSKLSFYSKEETPGPHETLKKPFISIWEIGRRQRCGPTEFSFWILIGRNRG